MIQNMQCRFVLGEGIEKKSADLAKDVEEQTNKMKEAAAAKAKEEPKEEKKDEVPEPTAEQVANLKVWILLPPSVTMRKTSQKMRQTK